MAKNVFIQQKQAVEKVKRNLFDLSFRNNLSMKFGYLYPVMCKEVYPGDSFRINASFGLRLMPMTFPVQTPLRANLHFFYVRTRNLWSDFPDFIGMTNTQSGKTFYHPYISKNSPMDRGTGSLADYLGIPTTVAGTYGNNINLGVATRLVLDPHRNIGHRPTSVSTLLSSATATVSGGASAAIKGYDVSTMFLQNGALLNWHTNYYTEQPYAAMRFREFVSGPLASADDFHSWFGFTTRFAIDQPLTDTQFRFPGAAGFASNNTSAFCGMILFIQKREEYNVSNIDYDSFILDGSTPLFAQSVNSNAAVKAAQTTTNTRVSWAYYSTSPNKLVATITSYMKDTINSLVKRGYVVLPMFVFNYTESVKTSDNTNYPSAPVGTLAFEPTKFVGQDCSIIGDRTQVTDVRQNHLDYNMFDQINISALPFRAYESIYNAFYRNQQVDPFKINNVIEYNKYCTTTDGAVDNTNYKLERRQWEQDFLTSCVPSPQQGIAPLVGVVRADGSFTVDSDSGPYNGTLVVGDDGESVVSVHSPDMPLGTKRALVDAIAGGITINDFRNVNALQKWLEKNIRRGYRYKDQIMSHFGVKAKFEELDMPEFLGGISRPVEIMTVTQTVQQSEISPLGDFAGNGGCFAKGEHSISKYFDEHGFIIAIMNVQPVPCYSQLLPKHFTHQAALDYMFPEFTHLGMQSVPYKEVCPLQVLGKNPTQAESDSLPLLTDTFGYQRPNYDLVGSVDEVHGQMRTTLQNYLMNRVFDDYPELSPDFVKVDPAQLNEVFAYTGDTDKIVGMIAFQIAAKRPIPRIALPRLD